MAEFGVKNITVGTAMNTSRDAVAYAEAHNDTWCAVGYHPEHVTSDYEDEDELGAHEEPFDIYKLEELASSSPRVLAIGECGLDYHRLTPSTSPPCHGETVNKIPFIPYNDLKNKISAREQELQEMITSPLTRGLEVNTPPDKGDLGGLSHAKANQLSVFQAQINVAAKLDKTLIVHMRDAEADMLDAIAKARADFPNLRIVMHSFTSTWKQAGALLDLGCFLGIGGIVTFKPRKTTTEEDILANIVKKMPIDRLLLETDCPWLAPVPVRGERNEPTHVRHIAQFIADLRGMSFEEISRITTENAQKCFNCQFTN